MHYENRDCCKGNYTFWNALCNDSVASNRPYVLYGNQAHYKHLQTPVCTFYGPSCENNCNQMDIHSNYSSNFEYTSPSKILNEALFQPPTSFSLYSLPNNTYYGNENSHSWANTYDASNSFYAAMDNNGNSFVNAYRNDQLYCPYALESTPTTMSLSYLNNNVGDLATNEARTKWLTSSQPILSDNDIGGANHISSSLFSKNFKENNQIAAYFTDAAQSYKMNEEDGLTANKAMTPEASYTSSEKAFVGGEYMSEITATSSTCLEKRSSTNSESASDHGENRNTSAITATSFTCFERQNEEMQKSYHDIIDTSQEVSLVVCLWEDIDNNVCMKTFQQLDKLVEHLSTEHIKKENESYKCRWSACPFRGVKVFKERYRLMQHLRVHTHDKPYACAQCPQKFARKENLTQHTRTHTGVKPYICPVCKKTFARCSDKRKHMRVHTEAREFTCDIENCGKAYKHPSSLRNHMRKCHSDGS